MDDFNRNLFDAIENNDEEYLKKIEINNLKLIDFKLFEKELCNHWYNNIKGLYYDLILKDIKKAKYYYELSFNQGNSFAQNNLGYLYKNHLRL